MAKDTFFSNKNLLNCGGYLLDLSSPVVMGILNSSPDSFYDGGRYLGEKEILFQVEKMLKEGATIIDVGGYSTRPGAEDIPIDEEKKRVLPVISAIHKTFPKAIISIDTFRAAVAKAAVDTGACIVNDISGGTMDAEMYATIAKLDVPYILTHLKGTPQTMQQHPQYDDVKNEVMSCFIEKIGLLKSAGVKDIILDPGFGFGKNITHNFELLKRLDDFKIFGLPLLAGVSRKSFIYKTLNITPEEALNGTTVLNTIALQKGAKILRVHDVKEAIQAVSLVKRLMSDDIITK